MRPKTLPRRSSSGPAQRLPFQRSIRPQVELLESRLVPSTIDYSMGFADHSGLTATGSASFPVINDQTVAQLTDGGTNETGTILTNDTVGTGQFHTDFTFVQAAGQTGPTGGELDFIFANEGRTFGIYFALSSEGSSSTGITQNGQAAPGASLSSAGINLRGQDTMHVTVDYDGTNLTWTIQDTATNATSPTFSAIVKIPSQVGTMANVGFSGSTGSSAAVQYVTTWQGTFSSVPSQPVPTLSSLSTTSVTEGANGLTLLVNGANFTPQSTVQVNGTNVGTAFVSRNQLMAFIPANLLAQPGTASITVLTPGMGSTAAQTLTINAAALTGNAVTFTAIPGIAFNGVVGTFSSGNPNALASNFTATINFGNGTTSTGTITALGNGNFQVSGTNTFAETGTFPVSITITGPGGASTTINSTANVNPLSLPTLSSLNTTSVMVGSSSLTLTLNGANFAPNSIVQFNGTNVATTFVNGNQLIAFIPASLLTHAGTVDVTVLTPGLGNTEAQSFIITEIP